MGNKKYIKTCRYSKCLHSSKKLDVRHDEYIAVGNVYYHRDCYEAKRKEEDLMLREQEHRKQQLKARKDEAKGIFVEVRDLWYRHIDMYVDFRKLTSVLNMLLGRGYTSDYILYTVKYCIDHKENLNYPPGLVYFMEKDHIKTSYKKSLNKKYRVDQDAFRVKDDLNAPSFKVKQQEVGFHTILK